MDPEDTAPARGAEATPRWYQRVLPVTALVVGLVAVASLVWPDFRDQVSLSASRQGQPFVELYFAPARSQTGLAVCTSRGAVARVRFVVASHLAERQPVAYRVSVDPTAKGERTQRRGGSVQITPDTSVQVTKSFSLPRGRHTISVRLPGLDQQLLARCPGRRT